MIELPFDYSRCQGGECPRKEKCARYTSEWKFSGQKVTNFSVRMCNKMFCDYFIDNGTTKR